MSYCPQFKVQETGYCRYEQRLHNYKAAIDRALPAGKAPALLPVTSLRPLSTSTRISDRLATFPDQTGSKWRNRNLTRCGPLLWVSCSSTFTGPNASVGRAWAEASDPRSWVTMWPWAISFFSSARWVYSHTSHLWMIVNSFVNLLKQHVTKSGLTYKTYS